MRLRTSLLAGAAVIASASLTLMATEAEAQSFNQFFGFGDSNIDSGYFLTHPYSNNNPVKQGYYNQSAAVGGGIPTTPGGPENSQLLASYFGLTAIPVGMPGGTNYAASGADNNNTNTNPLAPSTVSQINTYLAGNGGAANPNALYLINSGGNDVGFAKTQVTAGAFTGTQANAYMQQAATDLATSLTQLAKAGARYIIVSDGVGGSPTPIGGRQALYVNTLYAALVANGVHFIPADNQAMQQIVLNNASLFGFTSVANTNAPGGAACVNPNPALFPSSWALVCTTLRTPNAAQTSYWADDQHLSAAGQKIEADYDYSLIVAPSEISFLAEAPVKTRAIVVDTIQNQIAISQRRRAVGTYNTWMSGDIAHLGMNSGYTGFPSDPGTPISGTVGVDYAFAPGWLIGAAVSAGTTTQSFSLGGNYKMNEYAVSVYGAYSRGPIWASLIGSYGGMRYDVNRVVPIGVTMQSNVGRTSGSDPSLAAEIGYNFQTPIGSTAAPSPLLMKAAPTTVPVYLTHGPLAGILWQRVGVDGFGETDPFASVGGFTELSYAGQTRNSAVSELGYQAAMDLGIWHPFAKVAWNHELASTNRSVTAYVTSFAAEGIVAPGYAMPAVNLGKDWASATLGTTAALGRGMTAYATFNAQMGQGNVTTYGGQLGVNVALNAPPADPAKTRY